MVLMLAPLGVERNRGGWRVATEVGEAAYLYFRIPDSVWLVQFFEFVGYISTLPVQAGLAMLGNYRIFPTHTHFCSFWPELLTALRCLIQKYLPKEFG